MKKLIKGYTQIALTVYLTSQIITGFTITNSFKGILYSSLFLFFILLVIETLLALIMLPVNIITLNLTNWLMKIILLYIWMIITPYVKISVWTFPGINHNILKIESLNASKFLTSVVSAISIVLMLKFINWICK